MTELCDAVLRMDGGAWFAVGGLMFFGCHLRLAPFCHGRVAIPPTTNQGWTRR